MDLFENSLTHSTNAPLAERMRPQKLEEIVGQQHLLGEGRLLRQLIEQDKLSSLILWGPPGTGKTTLGQVIANCTQSRFVFFPPSSAASRRSGRSSLKRKNKEPTTIGRPCFCRRNPPL